MKSLKFPISFLALAISLALFPAAHGQPSPETNNVTNFERVEVQLERGGVLYGFVDLEGDITALIDQAEVLLETIRASEPDIPMPPASAVRTILEGTGIHGLQALGMSSTEYGSLFHNRIFLLMSDGPQGLFRIGGTANDPFQFYRLASSGTDLVYERQINGEALLEFIRMLANEAQPMMETDSVGTLEAFLQQPLAPTSITPRVLIDALSGRVMLLAEIDASRTISLPTGHEVQAVDLLLHFDNAASLFPDIAGLLRESGLNVVESIEDEGWATLAIALEGMPFPNIRIAAHETTGELIVASSPDYFARALHQLEAPVAEDAAFIQATRGLPERGTSFTYVTPEVSDYIVSLARMALPEKEDPVSEFVTNWVLSDLIFSEPMAAVASIEENGLLFTSNLNRSHKTTLISAASANPMTIGLVAAMAIPAFNKVRENSQEKTILNNLRQLRSAADQYFLETGSTSVEVSELIGPNNYIRDLPSIIGETYPEIITQDDDDLVATLPDGTEVRLEEY